MIPFFPLTFTNPLPLQIAPQPDGLRHHRQPVAVRYRKQWRGEQGDLCEAEAARGVRAPAEGIHHPPHVPKPVGEEEDGSDDGQCGGIFVSPRQRDAPLCPQESNGQQQHAHVRFRKGDKACAKKPSGSDVYGFRGFLPSVDRLVPSDEVTEVRYPQQVGNERRKECPHIAVNFRKPASRHKAGGSKQQADVDDCHVMRHPPMRSDAPTTEQPLP